MAGYRARMQARSWANIPILNEWKRRYPDRDPLALHRQYWGAELRCPGGGTYRWDETFATMASTVYGHPAAPAAGPDVPPALVRWKTANFGLTFEEEGLRSIVAWGEI